MYIAKPVLDADVVINSPKLKTHSATIYTGAVKNVFGCIPGLRKAMYHKIAPDKEDFGEILTDIHMAAKYGLHIMDGIYSIQGDQYYTPQLKNYGIWRVICGWFFFIWKSKGKGQLVVSALMYENVHHKSIYKI